MKTKRRGPDLSDLSLGQAVTFGLLHASLICLGLWFALERAFTWGGGPLRHIGL
jgi:hypothetical protein